MAVQNLISASTQEAFNTTLDGAIAAAAVEMDLTAVTGLQAPCVLVIDRQDASGNDTPSKREYVYVSAIATNTCTIERGLGGSSDQAHSDGAVVEEVMTASLHWEGLRTCVAAGHTDAGTGIHLSGTASIAAIQGRTALLSTASVGTLSLTNALGSKLLANSGLYASTASIGILTPVSFRNTVVSYTPDAAGTSTLDLTTGNIHHITMPAGNITIASSNEVVGQCFIIEILQDETGSRTVTWFTTIKWAGGSAPTLTTTASKRDTFGFRVTGTDTYDAYIVGQNV